MEKHRLFRSLDGIKLSPISVSTRNLTLQSTPILNFSSKENCKKKHLSHNLSNAHLSPMSNSENFEMFPQWLLERKDFKKSLETSENDFDIGRICAKEPKNRTLSETREVGIWCKSCVFFKLISETTCKEMGLKLKTKIFKAKDIIMKQGDIGDCMYIIYVGEVGIYRDGQVGCSGKISKGNVIGELALESNDVRSATVIAMNDVTVLQLKKVDYKNIVQRQKHKQRQSVVNLLKNLAFFKNLLGVRLDFLAWNMIILQYEAGDTLYNTEGHADCLYFLKEGGVDIMTNITITHKSEISITSHLKQRFIHKQTYEILVKKVLVGDFFGEEEFIKGLPYKNKAVCTKKSEILALKKDIFSEIFSSKEASEILSIHPKSLSEKALRKDLKFKLSSKNVKIKAFLDAINIKTAVPNKPETKAIMDKKCLIATKVSDAHSMVYIKE